MQDVAGDNSFVMYSSSLLSLGQCSGIQYSIYTDLSVVLQHIWLRRSSTSGVQACTKRMLSVNGHRCLLDVWQRTVKDVKRFHALICSKDSKLNCFSKLFSIRKTRIAHIDQSCVGMKNMCLKTSLLVFDKNMPQKALRCQFCIRVCSDREK